MKANKVPEKIYITPNFQRRWFTKEIDEECTEYICTDAFIEKAMKYIANHFLAPGMDAEIKDFVKYMKGE